MAAFSSINQKLPTVSIVGSTSGSFSVSPYVSDAIRNTTSGNSGTVGVYQLNPGRVSCHCHAALASGLPSYPEIVGHATISASAPSTDLAGNAVSTVVHYTFNTRSPSAISVTPLAESSPSLGISQATMNRINSYQSGLTRSGSGIVIYNSRPGSNICTVKFRVFKLATVHYNGADISGISPYDKSEVLIIKFILRNA